MKTTGILSLGERAEETNEKMRTISVLVSVIRASLFRFDVWPLLPSRLHIFRCFLMTVLNVWIEFSHEYNFPLPAVIPGKEIVENEP